MNFQEINDAAAILQGTSASGFRLVETSRNDPKYLRRLVEAQRIWNEYKRSTSGKRAYIQESAMRGDYPLLFADNLAREMRARYAEFPANWRAATKIAGLPDFRAKKIFPRGTISQRWTAIPDGGPQPAVTKTYPDQTAITYSLTAYGVHTSVNFQTLINDDMGVFDDIPGDMALGARRTELYQWSLTHWGASGPTNLTALTGNPALDIPGFRAAWKQLRKTVDANGEPIMIETPILEVGPDLETTANEIIKAVALQLHDDLTAAGTAFSTENWIKTMIGQVLVNPYVPIIASSANSTTSWCLLANASSGPAAIEVGYLNGYEEPALLQKASDTIVAGGGDVPINRFGNFATNDVEYKGIHMVGAVVRDAKLGFRSNGTGS